MKSNSEATYFLHITNIKLNIDGKEHIVTASTDVKQLARELAITQMEVAKFRDKLFSINQVSQAFQNAYNGLQQIIGLMQVYTATNTVQQEAETKAPKGQTDHWQG